MKTQKTYLDNHLLSRWQNELNYFQSITDLIPDNRPVKIIEKGKINDIQIVSEIINHNPDLIFCYGSSLIKSELISLEEKFVNIHLGLSPYYRTGTNIWPLINNELQLIGTTFMFIDEGVDTGEVFHQTRTKIFGDNPHSIGNRTIISMTNEIKKIILNFDQLKTKKQIIKKGYLYKNKDFDEEACKKLYKNFEKGIVKNFCFKNKSYEKRFPNNY